MRKKASLKSYHIGNLEELAIQHGIRLIGKKGMDNWTLRDLAKDIGVSHPALYRHFSSKMDLMTAIATEGFRKLNKTLISAQSESGDFTQFGLAYLKFATEHPTLYQTMFHPSLRTELKNEFQIEASNSIKIMLQKISTDIEAGSIVGAKETIFLSSWAMVHGLSLLTISGTLDAIDLFKAPNAKAKKDSKVVLKTLVDGIGEKK